MPFGGRASWCGYVCVAIPSRYDEWPWEFDDVPLVGSTEDRGDVQHGHTRYQHLHSRSQCLRIIQVSSHRHQITYCSKRLDCMLRRGCDFPEVTTSHVTPSLPLAIPMSMESINRFLYGPTPEQRVREWQGKLRQESRVLDREMRQVGFPRISGVYPWLTPGIHSWMSPRRKLNNK